MSNFNSALTEQMQRISVAKTVHKSNNVAAYEALVRADKVTELLAPFLGREVEGFTEHTPACFQQVFSTTFALDQGTTLAEARGAGRLATAIGSIRSVGSGFRKNVRRIEAFLQIDHAELVFVKDKALQATMPNVRVLYQSAYYFDKMNDGLAERMLAQESNEELSDEKRERLLLIRGWTPQKIVEYTTEYVARAIAYRMPKDARGDLINGNASFEDALKRCEINKVLTAAA